MKKIISVSVRNYPGKSQDTKTIEFDEVNKYLEEGWRIFSRDLVNSNTNNTFTMVFLLQK